jgi:large subunit ribosomal protein L25
MAEAIVIQADLRDTRGSANARRLRGKGLVPGVIYAGGTEATVVQLRAHEVEQELRRHSGENVMVDVALSGRGDQKVLLKEVQHHPLTGRVLHVDFQAVSLTEMLRVDVPIELVGEPVGEVRDGGSIEQLLRFVEVECLPSDIPDSIQLEVSTLEIGQNLSVGDLAVDPAKLKIIADSEIAVAHVSPPRVVEDDTTEEGAEAADVLEATGAAAEPEVITAKSDETEE